MDESPLPERCTLKKYLVKNSKYKTNICTKHFGFYSAMFLCFFVYKIGLEGNNHA